MKALSFIIDGEHFASDLALVARVTRKMNVTPVPSAPAEVAGIANIKGKVVTILNLAAITGGGSSAASEICSAVVYKPIDGCGDQMGILIDQPGDLVDIDNSVIVPSLSGESFFIRGVAEVDGELIKIIDTDIIVRRFMEQGVRAAAQPRGGANDVKTV